MSHLPTPEPLTTFADDPALMSLSVSPRGNGHGSGTGNGHGHGQGVARTADVIGRAESVATELDRLVRAALDATTAAGQAGADLQERLRLGVRMLQAFDVQIQRSEQANSQFAQNASVAAHAADGRVRAATELLEQRLRESVPFLDERLRLAHEQVARLVDERLARFESDLVTRLAPIEARVNSAASAPAPGVDPTALAVLERQFGAAIESLDARAKSVHEMLDRAERRHRELEARSSETADSLLSTIGTATTLKDLIGEQANASRRLADDAADTTRDLARELAELIERATIVRGGLERELRASNATRDAGDEIAAARTELTSLLARLEPWKPLLGERGESVTEVVESIAAGVRRSLSEDMRAFSGALRQLASRTEGAFAPVRFDEFSAARPRAVDAILGDAIAPRDEVCVLPTSDSTAAYGEEPRETAQPAEADPAHETRRLTAEILALDATSLVRPGHLPTTSL